MNLTGLNKPFFILSPMDDVTDTVFRQIVASCAPPDLCFSEFVNVEGLNSPGRSRIIRKLDHQQSEPPLVAHIWGINPDNFYVIADQLASGRIADELGLQTNFYGIDLNMGCPVRQVVKSGACSALINNHRLAKDIIDAVSAGATGRLPLSVKTRLGVDAVDPEWTRFLFNQNLSMLSIHLRTVKELSLVPAHYQELERIVAERNEIAPATLVVANGDIVSRADGEALADRYGLDGIMIGRGVFQDPYVFAAQSPWLATNEKQRIELFSCHLELFKQWSKNPNKGTARMNKYAKIYINGFNGAKELRERIAEAKSIKQMLQVLNNRLTNL
jgi:tRNA-dihydrouridine synthase